MNDKPAKIDIDQRYLESEEANRDKKPYEAFYQCLEAIFDMQNCLSFCDVGCSDGHLLAEVKKKNPACRTTGIEYFDYHLKYAAESIRNDIRIWDIRDPITSDLNLQKSDLVICTEVGEHIDPQYADALLNNLKILTGGFLIMTWSRHGGAHEIEKDPHHQHLNPLSLAEFVRLMEQHGFELLLEPSKNMVAASFQLKEFHFWWRESLSIWKVG